MEITIREPADTLSGERRLDGFIRVSDELQSGITITKVGSEPSRINWPAFGDVTVRVSDCFAQALVTAVEIGRGFDDGEYEQLFTKYNSVDGY